MRIWNKKGILLSFLFLADLASAQNDSTAVDTTGAGYRIGYQIGSWLPFLIVFTLALMVIIRTYRLGKDGDRGTADGKR